MRTTRQVQISRVVRVGGVEVTELCYRNPIVPDLLTGAKLDPLPSELTWVLEGQAAPNGLEAYIITEALVGTDGKAGQGQWGVCYTCREEYPRAEMSIIRGRLYCQKNGCSEEAQS